MTPSRVTHIIIGTVLAIGLWTNAGPAWADRLDEFTGKDLTVLDRGRRTSTFSA
jgi:hypothetical protein